jgi:NADPH:quinone reductase-like Zn-dependent oxidoreductase
MRAIVYDRYGPPEVLRFEELRRPVPSSGEVLVRVRAAGVNRGDCAWRTGDHPLIRVLSGVRRPKRRVLGSEFAGEVAALGRDVSGFEIGDAVFGVKAYLSEGFGAYAEYVLAGRRHLSSATGRQPYGAGAHQTAVGTRRSIVAPPHNAGAG